MSIEKSSIEEKIADLRKQLVNLQANANAVAGAIQFAEALLAEDGQQADKE